MWSCGLHLNVECSSLKYSRFEWKTPSGLCWGLLGRYFLQSDWPKEVTDGPAEFPGWNWKIKHLENCDPELRAANWRHSQPLNIHNLTGNCSPGRFGWNGLNFDLEKDNEWLREQSRVKRHPMDLTVLLLLYNDSQTVLLLQHTDSQVLQFLQTEEIINLPDSKPGTLGLGLCSWLSLVCFRK